MTLEADTIVARRRLKRSLSLWRVIAVTALAMAVLALGFSGSEPLFDLGKSTDHIARIKISGLITGSEQTLKLIDKVKDSKRVRAVILRIDSPGGTTAGSEALYERLRGLAGEKPVVAVMDTVAASGGYITAIAADHIVARGNTITGSIGVIFQWAEIGKLLETLGVRVEEIKSGELKAEPSMFNPLSDKVRAVTEAMVQDSFAWFTGLVGERRKLGADDVTRISDGRVFTGRQALEARLIDAIGGEEKAIEWLRTDRQIDARLKVVDWAPRQNPVTSGVDLRLVRALARFLGLSDFAGLDEKIVPSERLRLDGLLVVWHPALGGG